MFCNLKKRILFTSLFWLVLWLWISKMICKTWKAIPITFKSLKMEKIWERSTKVLDHRQAIGDGLIYPMIWKLEKNKKQTNKQKQKSWQRLGLLNVMPPLSNSITIPFISSPPSSLVLYSFAIVTPLLHLKLPSWFF